MYLPSGEKVAHISLNLVFTSGIILWSPSIVSAEIFHPAPSVPRHVTSTYLPSGDQSETYFSFASTSSGSGSFVPEASLMRRLPGPFSRDVYTMRRPSG